MTSNKLRLAGGLAHLPTEGDFGHDTLQEGANSLAAALREQPQPDNNGEPGSLSMELASLRGKVVWLNFWATWRPPCRKEMPDRKRSISGSKIRIKALWCWLFLTKTRPK